MNVEPDSPESETPSIEEDMDSTQEEDIASEPKPLGDEKAEVVSPPPVKQFRMGDVIS